MNKQAKAILALVGFLIMGFGFLSSINKSYAFSNTHWLAGQSSNFEEKYQELTQCASLCADPEKSQSQKAKTYIDNRLEDLDFVLHEKIVNNLLYSAVPHYDSFINRNSDLNNELINIIDVALSGGTITDEKSSEIYSSIENINATGSFIGGFSLSQLGDRLTGEEANAEEAYDQLNKVKTFFLEEKIKENIGFMKTYVYNHLIPSISPYLIKVLVIFLTIYLFFQAYRSFIGVQINLPQITTTIILVILGGASLAADAKPILYFIDIYFNTSLYFAKHIAATSLTIVPDMGIEVPESLMGIITILEKQWHSITDAAWELFNAIRDQPNNQPLENFFLGLVTAVAFWAIYTAIIVTMGALILYGLVYALLLIGLTPFYLVLFAFPLTRGSAMTWIRSITNYLILPPVCTIFICFMLSGTHNNLAIIINSANDPLLDFDWDNYVLLIVMGAIYWFGASRIGDWTAALTNGVSTNLSQTMHTLITPGKAAAAGAAGLVAAKSLGVLKGVGNVAGAGIKEGASAAGNKIFKTGLE